MSSTNKDVNEDDVDARLDQTMIPLEPEAFAAVLKWMESPLTEAEAEGLRRIKNAKCDWANDTKS